MRKFVILILVLFSFPLLSSCEKMRTSLKMIEADTAYNQGNIKKAIEIYKKILEKDSSKADVQWKLGIAYYSNGDKANMKNQIVRLRNLKRDDLAEDLQQLLEK